MSEDDLFTVQVFQIRNENKQTNSNSNSNQLPKSLNDLESIYVDQHPNMVSARVIKGRMIEFEHCNLYGQSVKFRTVVNYDRCLDSGDTLGVVLLPQDGYIVPEGNDSCEEG